MHRELFFLLVAPFLVTPCLLSKPHQLIASLCLWVKIQSFGVILGLFWAIILISASNLVEKASTSLNFHVVMVDLLANIVVVKDFDLDGHFCLSG